MKLRSMRTLLQCLQAAVVLAFAIKVDAAPGDAMDRAIAEAVALGRMPGLSLLEARNGKIVGERVYGLREAGGDPVAKGDVWHLGSDGKPMTVTLIARLVERGQLSWSMTLPELLPALSGVVHPGLRNSTLLDLVSHHSGLSENTDVPFVESFYDHPGSLTDQRIEYLRRALAEKPAVPRGENQYSNTALLAAAASAERVTGKAFEQLMQEEIFKPLGIKSAGFGPTPRGQPQGHEGGEPQRGKRADNPLMWSPAGGIYMNLEDWARFALDQIAGEKGEGLLLSAKSYAFLHTPVPDSAGKRVALDWGLRDEPFGRLLMHSGSNGYWYALIGIAPDVGNVVLVAANAAEDADAHRATAKAFFTITESWEPATANASK